MALENSQRTRSAALNHLQTYLILFYPEKHQLLTKIAEIAKELGGDITPPELKYKYLLVKKMFGWHVAKKMTYAIPTFKKRIFGNIDRLMFHLEKG